MYRFVHMKKKREIIKSNYKNCSEQNEPISSPYLKSEKI